MAWYVKAAWEWVEGEEERGYGSRLQLAMPLLQSAPRVSHARGGRRHGELPASGAFCCLLASQTYRPVCKQACSSAPGLTAAEMCLPSSCTGAFAFAGASFEGRPPCPGRRALLLGAPAAGVARTPFLGGADCATNSCFPRSFFLFSVVASCMSASDANCT